MRPTRGLREAALRVSRHEPTVPSLAALRPYHSLTGILCKSRFSPFIGGFRGLRETARGLREIDSWFEGNGTWFEGNRLVVWGVISRGLREVLHPKSLQKRLFASSACILLLF